MRRYLKFTIQRNFENQLGKINQTFGYPNPETLTETYATPEVENNEYLLVLEDKDYSRVEKHFSPAEKTAMVTKRPIKFKTTKPIT